MEQKGYTNLLQCVPQVIAAIPNVEFWLIGEGPLEDQLKEQCRQLGVTDKVKFLGQLVDVVPYIKRMDVFVSSSLWEGLPTVLMESMVCGTAVIATDIPGNRELIPDPSIGWRVPPGDASVLAQTIINVLLDDHKRFNCAQNARNHVKSFQIETITAQYDQLYKELLG